jgi:hypothetical protein
MKQDLSRDEIAAIAKRERKAKKRLADRAAAIEGQRKHKPK